MVVGLTRKPSAKREGDRCEDSSPKAEREGDGRPPSAPA
jgi:hypothetical protein